MRQMAHIPQQPIVILRRHPLDPHPQRSPERFNLLQRPRISLLRRRQNAKLVGKQIRPRKLHPRFSLPAIGWLATKCADAGKCLSASRTTERFVLPTSVTIAPRKAQARSASVNFQTSPPACKESPGQTPPRTSPARSQTHRSPRYRRLSAAIPADAHTR